VFVWKGARGGGGNNIYYNAFLGPCYTRVRAPPTHTHIIHAWFIVLPCARWGGSGYVAPLFRVAEGTGTGEERFAGRRLLEGPARGRLREDRVGSKVRFVAFC
jgi:hypothetical protein